MFLCIDACVYVCIQVPNNKAFGPRVMRKEAAKSRKETEYKKGKIPPMESISSLLYLIVIRTVDHYNISL
jgi:hypothetical protein